MTLDDAKKKKKEKKKGMWAVISPTPEQSWAQLAPPWHTQVYTQYLKLSLEMFPSVNGPNMMPTPKDTGHEVEEPGEVHPELGGQVHRHWHHMVHWLVKK